MKNLIIELKANNNLLSKLAIIIYRFGNWNYYHCHIPVIKSVFKMVYLILNIFIVRGIVGIEISFASKIGTGLVLEHPNGIVIHPNVIIGKNAHVYQQVTLGMNEPDSKIYGCPIVGDNVKIGAGAKVIGMIKVGNNSKIGANAVVISDVPENGTAVGVPAKNIMKTRNN